MSGKAEAQVTASHVSSPSCGLSEPFPTASDGSGYCGLAPLGLRLQAELFTSLIRLEPFSGTSPNTYKAALGPVWVTLYRLDQF